MLSAPKEAASQMMGTYAAYTEATTVRNPDGRKSVLNGPFAETKEQLAGFYLIEAPDLDGALSWAARCPGAAHGAIEVRPVWT